MVGVTDTCARGCCGWVRISVPGIGDPSQPSLSCPSCLYVCALCEEARWRGRGGQERVPRSNRGICMCTNSAGTHRELLAGPVQACICKRLLAAHQHIFDGFVQPALHLACNIPLCLQRLGGGCTHTRTCTRQHRWQRGRWVSGWVCGWAGRVALTARGREVGSKAPIHGCRRGNTAALQLPLCHRGGVALCTLISPANLVGKSFASKPLISVMPLRPASSAS